MRGLIMDAAIYAANESVGMSSTASRLSLINLSVWIAKMFTGLGGVLLKPYGMFLRSTELVSVYDPAGYSGRHIKPI